MATTHGEFYRGAEAASAALAAHAHADPAERAAAVHTAMAPLLADPGDGAPRACRDGCAHCCHFPVGITYGEALRLAAAVTTSPPLHARVLTAVAADDDRDWRQLIGRPCPLLHDGRCSTYAARPLPCRALVSSDAAACAEALHGGGAAPRDEVAFWRGLGAAATLAAHEPAGSRELRSALAALLAVGDEPGAAAIAFRAARPVG